MGARKTYDPLGIEIGLWNKDSSVFYVQCDCGELAKFVHGVYNTYHCPDCEKYYKKQRGQYIEIESID
ncbi:hypothetical protein [Enterococcus faecalis]|uniref:hypothetical protein n=1 Tax=Enterococcus faecalis TaxID=1351 RepID=UPI0020913DFA|nr:hypothetical protein [Enterococcus faecalis]MCO5542106.1 hypothetical protein [Enterococcus faecalis]